MDLFLSMCSTFATRLGLRCQQACISSITFYFYGPLGPPAWKIQENFPILSDSQSSSHLSLQSSVMGFSFSFGCHNRMPLVVQTKKLLHPDSIAGFVEFSSSICRQQPLQYPHGDFPSVPSASVLSLWRHHAKPVTSILPLSIEGLSPNMAMKTSTQEVDEIWLNLYDA